MPSTSPAPSTGPAGAIEELTRSLRATATLVTGVRPDQWTAPTPCPDWTVRELVNHLVTGNLSFVALLREQPPPDRVGDHLEADPVAAYRQAADDLITVFTQPGVFDRVYQAPPGPMPGSALLHLRIIEALVHGWDLAQATGQPLDVLPEDLAETELDLCRAQLAHTPRTGNPFGPAQPVVGDAPAIERLVAYLGRPARTDPAIEPSMYYVVQFRTTYRSLDDAVRSDPELIAAHVARSTERHQQGDLLMAGAFLDEPDSQELHTMAVTTTRAAADAYVAADPFVAAGKVAEHRIRAWANIFAAQVR